MTAPGASRVDPKPALAASATTVADAASLTNIPRRVSIPDFDMDGEWHFTDENGVPRIYSQNYPTCAYCGDSMPKVIVWAIEARATYHDVVEGVAVGAGMACPECAAILYPVPLFVRIAGWNVLFGDGRICCIVARIRKYADALWAKDETHLSDKWEAWAARLARNSAIRVERDHNPDACLNYQSHQERAPHE